MINFKFLKMGITSWIVLLMLLSIPSFSTLLQPGYFGMHDDLQVMRIYEMDKCFKDGQIPCRWIPDMGYGYGYPLFNYYPVMPYYLGELIHILGFSLIWSVKITFILSLIASAMTMFLLARICWGNLGGFISAMFYLYAPYHAVDVYVRGALAESWSLAWAPAIFLMIYLVIKKASVKNIVLLAVFVTLFLMSHNPMALLFTPWLILWGLLWIWQTKNYQSILHLGLASFWGLGLAAFFTIPVLLEGKYVHLETLFIGYFNYMAHFVDLNQLFVSRFWGFGASVWGPGDGMSFQIGWLHWEVSLLSLFSAIYFWKKDRSKSLVIIFSFGVFWLSSFLMHPRSLPIWQKITPLQMLQFPWRILSLVIFSSSLAVGSLIALPTSKLLRGVFLIVSMVGLLVLYQPYFTIEKPLPLTDQQKLSGALWDLQRTAGIFDYLPKSAKMPPAGAAPETVEVSSGSAKIKDFKRGTNWLSFSAEASESARLKLPIIDFPVWKVLVNGREIQFSNKNDLGQPTFEVQSGEHYIYAKLHDTAVRTASNIVSLISFFVLIYFIFKIQRS